MRILLLTLLIIKIIIFIIKSNLYIVYTVFRGSQSNAETKTSALFLKMSFCKVFWNTLKNPLSESLWLHSTTWTPFWTASKMSWCNISPVRYRSACTPFNTELPEPAHKATVEIRESGRKVQILIS